MSKEIDEDLRQVLEKQFTVLREDINKQFEAFNKTFKAMTFVLQKNKFLEPVDKEFIDSHLKGG
jgi:hypothetical protein